jgi:hypothetical protein
MVFIIKKESVWILAQRIMSKLPIKIVKNAHKTNAKSALQMTSTNVQNVNILDASMISHHNASQVTLRGHLRMNDNNPNLFESFHSLQKPSLHN